MGKAKRKRAERRARVPQSAQREYSLVWPKSMEGTYGDSSLTYEVRKFGPYDRTGEPGLRWIASTYGDVKPVVGARIRSHRPECPYGDSLPYDVEVEDPNPEPIGVDSFEVVYRCPACGAQLGPAMRDVNLVLDPEIAKQPLMPPAEPKEFGPTDASDIWRISDLR